MHVEQVVKTVVLNSHVSHMHIDEVGWSTYVCVVQAPGPERGSTHVNYTMYDLSINRGLR